MIDGETMTEALRVIIGGSPAAGQEAIRTMRAIQAGSPIVQARYNRTVELALGDDGASFTPAERRLLAVSVDAVDGEPERRERVLHIRLTEDEHARLQDAAGAAGQSVSVYVRGRIL